MRHLSFPKGINVMDANEFKLEQMKNRLRDLMYITAGLFDNPIQFGINVEEYLIERMNNILEDRPLFPKQPKQLAPPLNRLTDDRTPAPRGIFWQDEPKDDCD
jgi:hypothetical protein